MDIAVDASVIIAVIANEPEKEVLIQLTKGATLITSPSIHWEIGNTFSAMLKRNRISLHQALQAIDVYHQIPVRFADIELEEAVVIAAEHKIYAYDAYLIRCATKYSLPLLSLDRNLVKLAEEIGIEVIEVNS